MGGRLDPQVAAVADPVREPFGQTPALGVVERKILERDAQLDGRVRAVHVLPTRPRCRDRAHADRPSRDHRAVPEPQDGFELVAHRASRLARQLDSPV